MRSLVRSVVAGNRLAQEVYGGLLYGAGRHRRRAGRNYDALDLFCRARRHIPSGAVTARHARASDEVVRATCLAGGGLAPVAENRLLAEYRATDRAERLRCLYAGRTDADRVRLREPRPDHDPTREGSLIVLKRPGPAAGERGVVLLKYNKSFEELPAVFDLPSIVRRYRVVLEPSTTGYIEPYFFLYACAETDVVVQCTHPRDAAFFEGLGLNFRTVRLGGGDWVDFDVFRPGPDDAREFDLVMVASWARMRRHRVLFRALARLRPRLRPRVALVGYPEERTQDDLRAEMRRIGVEDQFTVFERIPPERVARVVASSKAALLLSKFEGSNKGIHEALFCDAPVIVYRHHVGMNMSYINPETGVLADDGELPGVIEWVLGNRGRFRPRGWAMDHTGYARSTVVLNDALRAAALARGEPWTRDIVPKVNRPNLRYKSDADRGAMAPAFDELSRYLL
jgi:glycosyltransferase involved in cell wall biosynthesis